MNKKDKQQVLLNEDINLPEVRCMDDEGRQYGIISSDEALDIANKEGFDLVLIAPNAKPPVVKIMDYGKFKYQQEKKAKEARKKQTKIDVKEIKLTTKIAQNDLNYKVKHALEFISQDKHVKFRVFLKGREMANSEAGFDVLETVKEMIKDKCLIEKEPFREGRFINMHIVPLKKDKKKN